MSNLKTSKKISKKLFTNTEDYGIINTRGKERSGLSSKTKTHIIKIN